MARSFTYAFEDSNGEAQEYEIVYSVTKGYGGTYEQPPEPSVIEFESITQNGKEVSAVPQSIIEDIEEKIWCDLEDDDDSWDYLDDE